MVADGHSDKNISIALGFSCSTIRNTLYRIKGHLGVGHMNRVQLAVWIQIKSLKRQMTQEIREAEEKKLMKQFSKLFAAKEQEIESLKQKLAAKI